MRRTVDQWVNKLLDFAIHAYSIILNTYCQSLLLLSESGGAHSSSKKLSYQQLGIAKLSGFLEWLAIHPIFADSDGVANLDMKPSCHKMIIFAHHHKVLDGIQVRNSLSTGFDNVINGALMSFHCKNFFQVMFGNNICKKQIFRTIFERCFFDVFVKQKFV